MDFFLFDTPLGPMALAAEEGALTRLWLPGRSTPRIASHPTPLLEAARTQLAEYFAGERKSFDLPLAPRGTAFQKRVWRALEDIPWGETRSYRDIALAADCPKGFRAVGMANHENPLPIFIPCHRVVGADGALTGYAGGLDLKRRLLELEGAVLPDSARARRGSAPDPAAL